MKLQRARKAMEHDRDELLKDLHAMGQEREAQPAKDAASSSLPAKDPVRSLHHSPGPIPTPVSDVSVRESQPARVTVIPAPKANARNRLGSITDPISDTSIKEAQLTVDTTIPMHLAGAATRIGTGMDLVNMPLAGTPAPVGTGMNPAHMHLTGTSSPIRTGMPPVPDTSLSGSRNASKHDGSIKDGLDRGDKTRSINGDKEVLYIKPLQVLIRELELSVLHGIFPFHILEKILNLMVLDSLLQTRTIKSVLQEIFILTLQMYMYGSQR